MKVKHDIPQTVILNNLPDGVMIYDRSARLVWMNISAARMLGFESAEEGYEHFSEYSNHIEYFDLKDNQISQENYPQNVALRGKRFSDIELRVSQDGYKALTVRSFSGMPLYDEQGAVEYAVVTMRDIGEPQAPDHTDSVNMGHAAPDLRFGNKYRIVENIQQHCQVLLNSLNEGIWIVDELGKTTFVNEAMAHMLQYTVDEIRDKSFFDFVNCNDSAHTFKEYMARRKQGMHEQTEHQFLAKDGSVVHTIIEASPLFDSDANFIGAIAGVVDITQRTFMEKALRESEERFRGTFENAAVGIAHVGMHGEWLRVNLRLCDIFGYTYQEFIQKTFNDITCPEHYLFYDTSIKKLLRGEIENFQMDKRCFHKDGHVVWISLTCSLQRDDAATPLYFICIIQDISAKKSTEEENQRLFAEIRKTEQLFKKLVEIAPVEIMVLIGSDYRYALANETHRRISGEKGDLIGRRITEIWPESTQSVVPLLDKVYATGRTIEFTDTPVSITLDGHQRTAYFTSVYKPLCDETGSIYGILAIKYETTKQVLSRMRLEELAARYKTVFDTVEEGLFLILPSGEIAEANAKGLAIHGFESLDEMNRHVARFPHYIEAFDLQGTFIPIEQWPSIRSLHGESISGFEARIRRIDSAQECMVSVNSKPVRNPDGNIAAVVHTIRDITEQKKIELEREKLLSQMNAAREAAERQAAELVALNRELEAFSYSLSHDLRTPLQVIASYSEILLDDYGTVFDEEGKEFLGRIMAGVYKINNLISDMLMLSKVTRQEICMQDIDMSGIVLEILEELHMSTEKRTIELAVKDQVYARADLGLIRVVLQNLLSNAWKFTAKKDKARIEFGEFSRNKKRIFFVRDNGEGFDMNSAWKLFVPFQRLHSQKDQQGNGVGLAIVSRAIKRMGGDIWAEAAVNKGATFYFTLLQ